jgi:3-hydroxyisobutyrate dehydrogenase-like beta-hydroxyacid dehydrogenase
MTSDGDGRLRVGLAGLGRMGTPMAGNLAAAGLLVGIHNRTTEVGKRLADELQVAVYATPAELAAVADVIVTSVADAGAVRDLYAGRAGFIETIRPGALAVEMSTVGPEAVQWLHGVLEAKDCGVVDAPVSGSVALAEKGELTIMAGGSDADIERAMPALLAIGARIFHLGPVGSGATMKLAVNNVIYGLNQSLAESLVLAEKAGIDRLLAYEVFAGSAIAAPFVHYRREAFERPGEIPAAMRLTLAEKDLDLILELAAALQARLTQAEANVAVAREAAAAGFGDDDIAAVAEYLRRG